MNPFAGLAATISHVADKWLDWSPQKATPKRRPYLDAGTNRNRADRFKSMRLISRRQCVDERGRWWLIEVRQCLHTGLIIKRTRRITD